MTIVCGDSHTSTHGAFGALAFGIGTSEVEHVLATQTLPQVRPRSLAITVEGDLPAGVTAKDIVLTVIAKIGTGGGVGSIIEFRGLTYQAVGKTNLAGTDLDVLTIAGRFPDYAPLCTSRREVGRPVVLVGRGGRRGPENGTHGWFIGDYDAAQRWGTNLVDSVIPASQSSGGELLAMGFNATAGADEGIFSAGDSGGGTFLLDRDNLWKLAGVNFGVDGPFTDNTNNSPVFGALFDIRGLYVGFPGQQQFIPNSPSPVAARSIVTRISSHIDWLSARIAEPAPADAVLLESAATPSGPFTEEPQYAVDPFAREIRAPRTNAVRFFRARGASVLTLQRFEGELGVFTFR
jgi:hypothetical protein